MKKVSAHLFGGLLLWQKLAILGLISFILAAIPFYFYFTEAQDKIDVAELETQGVKPSIALLKVIQMTQKHRGLSNIVLSGGTASAAAREAQQKETNEAVNAMTAIANDYIQDAAFTKNWTAAISRWQKLAANVSSAQITSSQSFFEHGDLIADYFVLLDKIADRYHLSMDPDPAAYFMIRSVLYATPQLSESLGKARATGSRILTQKQASSGDLALLSGLLESARQQRKESFYQIQKTFEARPDIKAALEAPVSNAYEQAASVISLAEREIINAPQITYVPEQYFSAYTTAIDAQFKLNDSSLKLMTQILDDKVTALRNNQIAVSLGLLALFAISTLTAYFIAHSITNPIFHLVNVMQKLSSGDTKIRANIETADEIGSLGRQFDVMLDQRDLVNAKIQAENDQLNSSVIELLTAVAKLSQKDLTARVPVAEDVTGLVADALNLLADETGKVMNRVVQIAHNVAKVSNQVKAQADNVINVASEEKREVEQAAAELHSASLVMMDIAKLARSCNEAAERAIQNTDKAQGTVLGTVQGITTIRDTIRETEKRIKRLGERSQEIGGVVNLINGIAERTHILALNASMHAASAGEAGRGFAVVANEVQRLAENAREATSKIAALVNNIQVETADTVTTMNDAISQVVKETELAQQAGNEMRETRDTTATLVQLVQRIANSSEKQALTTQRLRERAEHIQKSTEQTYEQLQAQGLQTEQLVNYSGNLVDSVSVFVLPKTDSTPS